MENPWTRIVSPETNGDVVAFVDTSTDSISDNRVVEVVFAAIGALNNPELMLYREYQPLDFSVSVWQY